MAELINKWDVVNKLIELENEFQHYKPFEGFEHAMYRKLCEVEIEIGKTDGIKFTPAVPGPSEADPNIMELCFRNGENHMREKIKHNLQLISKDLPCVPISQVIKIMEDL